MATSEKTCNLGLYEKAMPGDLSFVQMLQAAGQAGFDHVELSIDESDRRLARLDWDRDQWRQIAAAQNQVGLAFRTLCLSGHRKYPLGHPDPAVRRRSLDIMEKALALADFLGIRIIQLAGYDVYYEKGDAQTRALFQENLARCADMAARYGVHMGFETMETPFMDTVGKAMGFVAAIHSPYLGVYPDLGNLTNAAVKYQGDLYADLGCGRGHLLAMHLKETRPGQYRDMEFGSGHVDFVRGAETARALGVNLFVTEFWHDGRPDWQDRLASVRAFIRRQTGI